MVAAGGGFAAGFWGTAALSSTGFVAGAASGGAAGFIGGAVGGFANSLWEGKSFGAAFSVAGRESLIGALAGGTIGGIVGGVDAFVKQDLNVWSGQMRGIGRTRFAMVNADRQINAFASYKGEMVSAQ